jgi:2-polyprenyl-3-methyl-5-hydroxy-6-metoxy-1,4-benzoquinol methylase
MPLVTQPAAAVVPDFTQRVDPADLPELMDEPCSYEAFRDCVRDIAATTRLTLAYAPTLRFVEQATKHLPERRGALHIVDVGSGGGDVLRRLALWARRRNVPLQLTGIDLNPHATRAAREFSAANPVYGSIQWTTGDVFTHAGTQSPDLVVSSLVTHHMRDDEIVRFLRWMERHARLGWFISDLVRSPRSYQLFRLLSRTMRWHPFVQHDGLVSIRRALGESDWRRLLTLAEIPANAVQIRPCALGRLCVTRLRPGQGQRSDPVPAPNPA